MPRIEIEETIGTAVSGSDLVKFNVIDHLNHIAAGFGVLEKFGQVIEDHRAKYQK